MNNDSTTAGYLTPVGDLPKYDEALEREISRWIRGVSGLAKEFVFSRWTDPQPQIPKNGINWCGFGITSMPRPVTLANIQTTEEESEQWSWETVVVICCFYGPQGASIAATFREGIYVAQNNAELNKTGLSLVDTSPLISAPELINNQWVRRYDLTATLSRKNIRTYNIRTIQSAPVTFFGE
ncbi:bacteriophage protein [Cedecea neteri]|uniref:Bacteriophage protein n=1 Tax=Cedecea neteri TaxID=158822 RepID=A0A089Q4B3_9ENTR|nr:hypothetical protein [Cedecea neteri]AIR07168.1 bacteriophage protein [Cedecea neteri]